MMNRFFAAITLLSAVPIAAQEDSPVLGHPEMKAMFVADQEVRHSEVQDWEAVRRTDAELRERVRELLDAGALTTEHDFYAAAFIFQHGDEPEDYLLAHALAIRALGLGMQEAEWIAAATLDRYFQSIARDQIYGTQYHQYFGKKAARGRYDPHLLTDQLRQGAGVETLDEQTKKLDSMNTRAGTPE